MGVRKFPIIDGKKQCVKCEELLPFTSEYYCNDKSAPGGLTAKCRKCRYEQKREWELNNNEKLKESQRLYYQNTKENYLGRKQEWRNNNRDKDRKSSRSWAINNPEKRSLYQKLRYSLPHHKIVATLRARVRRCIKNGSEIYKDLEGVLGYSTQELKCHIESTFKDGMTWDNYCYTGWHVDHIRPVSSYSLSNADGTYNSEEVKACWALTNLQALWGTDNMIKSNSWGGCKDAM